MHAPRRLLPVSFALLVGCGPAVPPDVCGVSGVVPTDDDVQDGFGLADRDGEKFEQAGSWGAGPSGSVDLGTLSMIIAVDETGTEASDLIARRAFPICVPLGERSPLSGSASYPNAYITDESHTGGVALLGEEGGLLLGRFAVELVEYNSDATTSFTNGVFRVGRR